MGNDNNVVSLLMECRTDFDGKIMPDWAEPIGCDCGLLREAAEEIESLRSALRHARDELKSLPRSFGYEITALPKIEAALKGANAN